MLLSSRLVLSELNYLGWSCVKLMVGRKKSKTSSSRLYQIYSKIVISYLVLFHRVSSSPFFPKPDFLAPPTLLSLSLCSFITNMCNFICMCIWTINHQSILLHRSIFLHQSVCTFDGSGMVVISGSLEQKFLHCI